MSTSAPPGGSGGSGGVQSTPVTLIPASGASQVLQPTGSAKAYDITLTAACSFTITGGTAGLEQSIDILLRQNSTGGYAATFGGNVVYAQGLGYSNTTNASRADLIQITSFDGFQTYILTAIATNLQSNSIGQPPSNNAVAPNAPSMTVAAGSGQVTISWTDGLSNGAAITSHKLYRGTTSGAETLIGTISTASPYIDTGLTNGTTYFYQLTAVNSAGESTKSVEASAAPAAAVSHYLVLGTSQANQGTATAPSTSTLNANTTVLDAQIFLNLSSYVAPNTYGFLFGKWASGTEWELAIDQSGHMRAIFFDSSGADFFALQSTATISAGANTNLGLRMVINNNATAQNISVNGSSFSVPSGVVMFYTSPDFVNWTQLGSNVTIGIGSASGNSGGLKATGAVLAVGGTSNNSPPLGNVFKANMYLGTTLVSNPDFTAQSTGAASFTDGQSNTFTVNSPSSIH